MSSAAADRIPHVAKLFAIRLTPNGIAVYEVRPGLIHLGTPEDVGGAVAIMAAGELPFTTSAAIQVDSGISTNTEPGI